MALVRINKVEILNNPAPFLSKVLLEVEFESLSALPGEGCIECKLVYVGSATGKEYDQILDEVEVGPVAGRGVMKFVLETDPPNPEMIPPEDLLGVTIVILTCQFRSQEFARVGYYVSNEYDSEELNENPPENPDVSLIVRRIVSDKPRITMFEIDWS